MCIWLIRKANFLLRHSLTEQKATVLNGKNIAWIGHKEEVFLIRVVRCRKNYPREVDASPIEVFKVR